MPLSSMTGYGRGEASSRGLKVEVELSSVNRRQFDVRVGLPRELSAMEAIVYEAIHDKVSRGAVTGTVDVRGSAGRHGGLIVDEDMAGACVRRLRALAREHGLKDDLSASSLTTIPGLIRPAGLSGESSHIEPLLRKALHEALEHLLAMRRNEGTALERDLSTRFGRLKALLAKIRRRAPRVPVDYRKRLEARLAELGLTEESHDPHVLKELAIFADRCDVSEEITRLDSHFRQADELIAGRKPAGRTLDFLCQEMLREINTIGSKANDAHVARQVIDFKTELEAAREQVQNVE